MIYRTSTTTKLRRKMILRPMRHAEAGGIVDSVTDQALLGTLPVDKPSQRGRGLLLVFLCVLLRIAGDRLIVSPTRISVGAPRPPNTRATVQGASSRR